MPNARPGEVWQVDLGMVAKSRPCLVLTLPPKDNELAVFTVVAHTTSLRGNHWEMPIRKHFLAAEGAFDLQRVTTVVRPLRLSKAERRADAAADQPRPGAWPALEGRGLGRGGRAGDAGAGGLRAAPRGSCGCLRRGYLRAYVANAPEKVNPSCP